MRLIPPLIVTQTEIDKALGILEGALEAAVGEITPA